MTLSRAVVYFIFAIPLVGKRSRQGGAIRANPGGDDCASGWPVYRRKESRSR